MAVLELRKFKVIDLSDPFFDSLKDDYKEFAEWFERKSKGSDQAYVFINPSSGKLDGFLYLKIEDEALADISPPQTKARRLKVGTFKVNAHGTRLGERFLKKVFDHALEEEIDQIYVTIFPKHAGLVSLFKEYGFTQIGTKSTTNGTELVLLREISNIDNDPVKSYPVVRRNSRKFLLGIYPKFHTRLFPDSKLITDDIDIIKDVSHTNSIHKIYICGMNGVAGLRRGDSLLIYRTTDGRGPARFRSVATSIGVVEEYRHILSFENVDDFLNYTLSYSVFTEEELREFYRIKKPKHIIRFTYNYAFKKRPNRDKLLEVCGFPEKGYYGFFRLKNEMFDCALQCSTNVPKGLVR